MHLEFCKHMPFCTAVQHGCNEPVMGLRKKSVEDWDRTLSSLIAKILLKMRRHQLAEGLQSLVCPAFSFPRHYLKTGKWHHGQMWEPVKGWLGLDWITSAWNTDIPFIQLGDQSSRRINYIQYAYQMGEHCLPCPKLELVHDIHYQHGERVETKCPEFHSEGNLRS